LKKFLLLFRIWAVYILQTGSDHQMQQMEVEEAMMQHR
jgi:hypothetical protein